MNDKDIRFAVTAEDRFSRVFQTLKRDIASTGQATGRLNDIAAVGARAVSTLSLGTVAGAGGIALALRNLSNDLDALNDASDAIGDSVENLSAIENVARRNGESLDLVVTASQRLNKALKDADPKSPVAQALEEIGLSAKELQGLNTTDSLQRIAQALSGYENSQRKANIIAEIFGKNSRQVAAFLGDLAEAGVLNATVTTKQAAEAAKFNKQLFALTTNASDLARVAAGPLLTGFNEFFDVIKGLGPGTLSQTLAVPLQTIAVVGANVGFVIKGVGTEIGGLAAQGAALARLDFAGVRSIGAEMRADAKAAREEFDKVERRLLQIGAVEQASYSNEGRNRAAKGRGLPDRPQLDGAMVVRPAVRVDFPPEVEALQNALRRLEQTDTGKLDRLQNELAELFELQRETRGAPAVAEAIRALNEELDGLANARLPTVAITDSGEAQRAAFLRSEKDAYGDVERYIKDLANNGAKDFGRLGVTIDRFAESSIDALLDLGAGGEFSAKRLYDAFRRDLLREFIEDPVRESMQKVVKSIKKELSELDGNGPIAQLFKLLKGGGSSIFSTIGSIFTGGDAGLGADVGFTGRSLGGGVKKGQLVRWEENGREWFRPGEDGTVITQRQMQGMGGNFSAVYNFSIQGGDPRETARQVRAMLDERDARQARSMRYGKMRSV